MRDNNKKRKICKTRIRRKEKFYKKKTILTGLEKQQLQRKDERKTRNNAGREK